MHGFLHLPFLLSETLSQLHGTGLYFKKSLGGSKGVLEKFPNIEEQIQIRKFAQHIFKTDIIIQDTFKTVLCTLTMIEATKEKDQN